jgi:[NiFe] hydrogenase assembly HybE family chaperone
VSQGAPGRFEGSYLGDAGKISDRARLECKICWTPYDPAAGDETRMIPPGTPFRALPDDWRCPTCDGAKAQFMVTDDPGAAAPEPRAEAAAAPGEHAIDRAAEAALRQRLISAPPRLVAEFREIWHAKMRDVPLVNRSLHVEAVGFRAWEGRPLGVLVTPWFMNLFLLPAPGEDWSGLTPGAKELIDFPSGAYEFIANVRPMAGPYKACSLFSPMDAFSSQLQATDCARAVMAALFDPANRAETTRAGEIRAAREAGLRAPVSDDAPAAALPGADGPRDDDAPAGRPSRRAVLTAGLSQKGREA